MRVKKSLAHDEKAEKSFPNDYVPDRSEQSAVGMPLVVETPISSLLVYLLVSF